MKRRSMRDVRIISGPSPVTREAHLLLVSVTTKQRAAQFRSKAGDIVVLRLAYRGCHPDCVCWTLRNAATLLARWGAGFSMIVIIA